MPGTDALSAMDRLASRQYGLVTVEQLAEIGVSGKAARRLVERGLIIPVRRGVYRLCGSTPSWRASVLAAVLGAGPDCALSHSSAGVLWGLINLRHGRGVIEISSGSCHRMTGVVGHRHVLPPSAVTTRFGIPLTTVERTILDLAERFATADLGRLMDEAMRRDLTSPSRLHREVHGLEHRGRRRVRPYLEALEDRGIGYDPGANDWEQRMDRMWDELGLPPARRQYRVRISGRSFKLDRAIVEAKIAVEWNGHYPHGERSKFDYDSDRRALLIGAGWLPLDFTSRSSPELIRRTVLSAYEQRRRDGPIPAVG